MLKSQVSNLRSKWERMNLCMYPVGSISTQRKILSDLKHTNLAAYPHWDKSQGPKELKILNIKLFWMLISVM